MKPKRLTKVNPQIESWPEIRTEVVRWKSFDGMEIEGLVHWPHQYRQGRRYPLLVVPHGGPHSVMSNLFVERRVPYLHDARLGGLSTQLPGAADITAKSFFGRTSAPGASATIRTSSVASTT